MDAQSSTIDPSELGMKCLTLCNKNGQAAVGTFVEVVKGLFYVATSDVVRNGKKVKAGTCFVYEASSVYDQGTFQQYQSIYRAIRAYLTYAKGWALMHIETLGDLHALTQALLANLFGLSTMEEGEFAVLDSKLYGIVTTSGVGFTTNRQVRHALVVFNRTRKSTRRGSQLLGFGNSGGKIARRLQEVRAVHRVVVSIGTLLSQYLGAVLGVVAEERRVVSVILGYGTDQLITLLAAEQLDHVAQTLEHVLVVRPTTHVGAYAMADCKNAAQRIRVAVQSGATDGVSEAVRNLIVNVRDSLDLLQWQYDLEQVITVLARPSKDKTGLNAAEWTDLDVRVEALILRIVAPLGSRFKNQETMPKIRRLMHAALEKIRMLARQDADDPVEVKALFIEASDAV